MTTIAGGTLKRPAGKVTIVLPTAAAESETVTVLHQNAQGRTPVGPEGWPPIVKASSVLRLLAVAR